MTPITTRIAHYNNRMLSTSIDPTIAAAAALACARLAAAQQPRDAIRLDSLVVTATRLPLPRAAVASAVTVVTGDALRAEGITTLLEALRTVPGAMLVQGGGYGTPASLFLRGGETLYGVGVAEPENR